MSDNKKMKPINMEMKKLTDDGLTTINAGLNKEFIRYTCVNPACPMYLTYLSFNPPGGRCEECGMPTEKVI